MDPQPTLTTARLLLRPLQPADAPAIQRLAGDRDVAATTLRIPHPYEDGLAEEWLRNVADAYASGMAMTFAIASKEGGELLGAIGLVRTVSDERAELGYWIGKPYWNCGYATEAAAAVLRYGFEQLALNRIHATHFVNNPQSGRVMQKVGMRYEGRLREHLKKWGAFHDIEYYGMLRADFDAGHNDEG